MRFIIRKRRGVVSLEYLLLACVVSLGGIVGLGEFAAAVHVQAQAVAESVKAVGAPRQHPLFPLPQSRRLLIDPVTGEQFHVEFPTVTP